MPHLRLRFTVRRILLAVSLVACCFGVGKMWSRQRVLRSLATFLTAEAARDLKGAESYESAAVKFEAIAVEQQGMADRESRPRFKQMCEQHATEASTEAKFMREEAQEYRTDAAKHSRLAMKFQKAASRPWLFWRSLDPELRALKRID